MINVMRASRSLSRLSSLQPASHTAISVSRASTRLLSKRTAGVTTPPMEGGDHPFQTFIQTDVESVFTMVEMEDEYADIVMPHRGDANKLFNLPTRYIHPKEFNYALPSDNVPEFAFVGRSNVGKSSLIATLLHSKSLVKISKAPGCTKSVNYFAFAKRGNAPMDAKAISGGNASSGGSGSGSGSSSGGASRAAAKASVQGKRPELYLVDLPGYGFAKAGKQEQKRWKAFIKGYLESRDMSRLRRVFVLVDARHGPKDTDNEMMMLLNSLHLPYQMVLTKTDAANKYEIYKTLYMCFEYMKTHKGTSTCVPYVFATSSKKEAGVQTLKDSMAEVLSHEWTLRERQSASGAASAGAGGSIAPMGVLGQGPDDISLATAAGGFSPSPSSSPELAYAADDGYDDEEGAEERDIARTLGASAGRAGAGGSRLNADDFKSILKASGTSPEKVQEMMEEYKQALRDR